MIGVFEPFPKAQCRSIFWVFYHLPTLRFSLTTFARHWHSQLQLLRRFVHPSLEQYWRQFRKYNLGKFVQKYTAHKIEWWWCLTILETVFQVRQYWAVALNGFSIHYSEEGQKSDEVDEFATIHLLMGTNIKTKLSIWSIHRLYWLVFVGCLSSVPYYLPSWKNRWWSTLDKINLVHI